MSGNRTLLRPYPKEKDPFHEDATKSKSRIKRTFSNIKESLRRSFRKKPEPQANYTSGSSQYVKPKRIEPQEEFVIRSRIPDRVAAMTEASHARHTVAAISTPVPPPRTSSIRKRNRLNSTSSGCSSTNPFNDAITPLFPDTSAITHSRHTLNVAYHGRSGMYGSESTLRTSCESICTVGGTRRKKRNAPQPPINTSVTVLRNVEPQDDSSMLDTSIYMEEVQRLQIGIEEMNAELNQNTKPFDSDVEVMYSKDDFTCARDEKGKLNIDTSNNDATIPSEDSVQELTDDGNIELNRTDDIITCYVELPKPAVDISYIPGENESREVPRIQIDIKPSNEELNQSCELLNDSNEPNEGLNQTKLPNTSFEEEPPNKNPDISDTNDSSDPVEYVSTETIVLKRIDSQRDTNGAKIQTPPIEVTTFQSVKKVDQCEATHPVSVVQKWKARFETGTIDEERHVQYDSKRDETDIPDKANVGVDINSNELYSGTGIVFREKLKGEEAQMRYIDDDRDDILEVAETVVNIEKRSEQ